jgi:GTP cyclohydrolase II
VEILLDEKNFKKNADLILLMISGDVTLKYKLKMEQVESKQTQAALQLARIAELLPASIQILAGELTKNSVKISADDVLNYKNIVNASLQMVAETPLKLKDAKNVRIKAFRPQNGGSEHLAIIIGDISNESPKDILIRLHSSCYTGDLLGSLACDCGDQLRDCIRLMNKEGAGVIIYLIQEGRGIGLINKLKAYDLQANGLDTVEANEFLGFDDEEREFEPAAKILRELGISTVRLVTNNPRKAKDLEELGIKVSGLVPLLVTHEHNHNYVQTKGKKSGHIIN